MHVSMPHAALCVSGPGKFLLKIVWNMFQCRTRHYVCRDSCEKTLNLCFICFNAARGIMCVGTTTTMKKLTEADGFNAARGIMCVGTMNFNDSNVARGCFNAARGIMCVGTDIDSYAWRSLLFVSMPHAALCVSGLGKMIFHPIGGANVSMPHAALCVSGLDEAFVVDVYGVSFNAARGIMCVGTGGLVQYRGPGDRFNAARGIMCVGTGITLSHICSIHCFNAARGIMCVGTI